MSIALGVARAGWQTDTSSLGRSGGGNVAGSHSCHLRTRRPSWLSLPSGLAIRGLSAGWQRDPIGDTREYNAKLKESMPTPGCRESSFLTEMLEPERTTLVYPFDGQTFTEQK